MANIFQKLTLLTITYYYLVGLGSGKTIASSSSASTNSALPSSSSSSGDSSKQVVVMMQSSSIPVKVLQQEEQQVSSFSDDLSTSSSSSSRDEVSLPTGASKTLKQWISANVGFDFAHAGSWQVLSPIYSAQVSDSGIKEKLGFHFQAGALPISGWNQDKPGH